MFFLCVNCPWKSLCHFFFVSTIISEGASVDCDDLFWSMQGQNKTRLE